MGKSTLLNRILGEKIAIVSKRPQTTRNRILAIKNIDGNQLVLVDTPGIHRNRANLNRFMVKEAIESIHGVDCILLLTEVDSGASAARPDAELELDPRDRYVLQQIRLQGIEAPVIVVINKIDRVRDQRVLLPLMEIWRQQGYTSIVPISALNGDGVPQLLEEVLRSLPEGAPLYPEEMVTDRAERFLAEELIREQIFVRCHKEVPYSVAVVVDEFKDRPDRADTCIEATICVERESQKAIVVGKGGRMIKIIGSSARDQIARLLGCVVHLKLVVRVEPNWSRTPSGRRKLGYE